MVTPIKSAFRALTTRFGYGVFDLRKDQSPAVFLGGHLRALFERLDINCVIDVGANVGQYGSLIRRAGYAGRILSIEPLAEAYAALRQRARSDQRWQTMNLALGEKDETRLFNIFAADDLSSFLVPSAHMAHLDNSFVIRCEAVTVRRLASIFADIVSDLSNPRLFLKLDTQGYDLQVVNGATDCLPQILGIQSELAVIPLYEGAADHLEMLAYYRHLGFYPTGIFPVAKDRKTGHVFEFDAVFARRDM